MIFLIFFIMAQLLYCTVYLKLELSPCKGCKYVKENIREVKNKYVIST